MPSRQRIEVVPDIEGEMYVKHIVFFISHYTKVTKLTDRRPVSKQHSGLYRNMTWLLPVEGSDLPMMVRPLFSSIL